MNQLWANTIHDDLLALLRQAVFRLLLHFDPVVGEHGVRERANGG